MLIVCPNCATSYSLSAPALGAGRTVRCARCRTQWFATPTREAAPQGIVDELIAEASARNHPAERPPHIPPSNPPPAAPPAAAPEAFAPLPPAVAETIPQSGDAGHLTAALDQISAVAPMTQDDVAMPDAMSAGLPAAPTIDIGDAPPIVPPDEPHPADLGKEDIEQFAARRAARHNAQNKRRRALQIPALVILLGLIAGALVVWRNDLARHLPQTASLFSAIGLPVNVRNLIFEEVTVSKDLHDGVTVLTIEGKIVSIAGRPADVPRLRFAIRNASGNEVYTWTAQPPRSVLGAGESVAFRSRLASPPADANDVLVRFFTARDLATGNK